MLKTVEGWLFGVARGSELAPVSRVVTTGDVARARDLLVELGARVVTRRSGNFGSFSGPAFDIDNTNTGDLNEFRIDVYDPASVDGAPPFASLFLGRDGPYMRALSRDMPTTLDLDRVTEALQEIERSGRRRVLPERASTMLDAGVVLAVGAVWFWCAATVWTTLPERVLTVGLVFLISGAINAGVDRVLWLRRFPMNRSPRVAVVAATRDQWRERRWSSRRDYKVSAVSVIAGAGSALLAALLAGWLKIGG